MNMKTETSRELLFFTPSSIVTPKELTKITKDYISTHYPDWPKNRFTLSVRWSFYKHFIWDFKFKNPEDASLLRKIGIETNPNDMGQPQKNIKTLLDCSILCIDQNNKFLVVSKN